MESNTREASSADRLEQLGGPIRIGVRCDAEGKPQSVVTHGKRHRVERITDAWRIDDEWWHHSPLSRLYLKLILDDGRIVTAFCDLVDKTWWEQRY